MKRIAFSFLVVLSGVWLAQAEGHRHGASISTNDEALNDDCNAHLQVSGTEFKSVMRDEQSQTLPNQPLTIHAEHNGGIQDHYLGQARVCHQTVQTSCQRQ